MPVLVIDRHHIAYDLHGPSDGPGFVLVNGLTQYADLWAHYRNALASRGYSVATFDLLGQGGSDKPIRGISQDDQVRALAAIVDRLAPAPVYVAGISFGGYIALKYAVEARDRIAGLVAMSTFSELSPQLTLLGACLYRGLLLGGIDYLQDLLLPMNLSDAWLGPQLDNLPAVKRQGAAINDLFALQNLMESFIDVPPLTPALDRISCPTLILNGEFDFLTPRPLHDLIRRKVPRSRMAIVPQAYHAFTLEKPDLTADLMARFADDVAAGNFFGDQTIWLAPDQVGAPYRPFPEGFDPMRALPAKLEPGSNGENP